MITPLWFGREGEAIYLGTSTDSFHARHMAAAPHIVILFADQNGRRTRRVLRVHATASVGPTARLSLRRKLRLAKRYYLQPKAALHWLRNAHRFANMRRYYTERPNVCTIEVTLDSAEWLEQPGA